MPFLLTGVLTVLYTLFVYYDVLLKKDPDWKWIIAIFCATWIILYWMKRRLDHREDLDESERPIICFQVGANLYVVVTSIVKFHLIQAARGDDISIDICLFFAATSMFAAYFLLCWKSAQKLEWDSTISWKFRWEQLFFVGFMVFYIYLPFAHKEVQPKDLTAFIFHQTILSIFWALVAFDVCAVSIKKYKLKESVKRPAPSGCKVVDEGISLPVKFDHAAEGDINGKKTLQDKEFII